MADYRFNGINEGVAQEAIIYLPDAKRVDLHYFEHIVYLENGGIIVHFEDGKYWMYAKGGWRSCEIRPKSRISPANVPAPEPKKPINLHAVHTSDAPGI